MLPRMDIEERYKVCQLIEFVIAADGEIADAEREFLRKVVERFGLPEREAGPFSENDIGRATTTLRTLSPDVRGRVMALLVEAAVADGRIDPQERDRRDARHRGDGPRGAHRRPHARAQLQPLTPGRARARSSHPREAHTRSR